MATLPDYATIDDLEQFWRTLKADESTRASTLISMASNYLRQVAKNNKTDLDEKITEDTSGVLADSVKMITLSAVKRAMLTPTDAPPADQWSQAASPYSESMTFTNPSNDLFFKRNELLLLGLGSVSGKSQFGILRGARGVVL